jgi:hypothetical protein
VIRDFLYRSSWDDAWIGERGGDHKENCQKQKKTIGDNDGWFRVPKVTGHVVEVDDWNQQQANPCTAVRLIL